MGDVHCNSDCLPSDYGEGEHYRHCIHDCIHNGERSGVCCHCGDIFLADDEPNGIEHGEYAPDSEAAIARLTAELAAARAMVPSEGVMVALAHVAAGSVISLVEMGRIQQWLARVSTARVEGEG